MSQPSLEVPAEAARVPAGKRFYQPELDGLRFYAFLGVFFTHSFPLEEAFYHGHHLPLAWLWAALMRAGAAGVDLFFALSAYLITSLLLKERRQTGSISLRLFYIRRALRIWPLYYLVVALGVLFAYTMAHHQVPWFYQQSLPWYYVAGYVFFVSNWVYAAFGVVQSVCAPLWTVAIEEQFYLLWPALMKRLAPRGMVVAALLTLVLATLSQAAIVWAGAGRLYIAFGSASRCESLALGILLALGAHRLPRLTGPSRFLLVLTGVAGWVVTSWWLFDDYGQASMGMVYGRLIVALASGGILYGCLGSSSKWLTGSWIVRLGRVSYGLYMLHFTGLLLAATLMHPVGPSQLLLARLFGFGLTIVLAFLSYRWVESPFLRWKDRFATVLSRPV